MSHFAIQNFISNLGESARPNLFKVVIAGDALDATARTALPYLLFSAEIPQTTVEQVELRFRGRQVFEPGERNYQPWNFQIYNDVDFKVRGGLEKWSYNMRNAESVNGQSTKARYTATIYVYQLDRAGSIKRTYVLHNAWPTDIQNIQLDYQNGSQVEQYGVTFIYDYFEFFNGPHSGSGATESGDI